jgi:hypothetical protein
MTRRPKPFDFSAALECSAEKQGSPSLLCTAGRE